MKKIYLVRHCSAAGQHKDSPLSREGIRQAQLLSIFLSDLNVEFDKIISSPYLRAIESIKPYAQKKNIKVNVDERLQERILSNEPVEDWLDILEHSFNNYGFHLKGGESASDAVHRINEVIRENLMSDDSNIMLITHGNILSFLLNQYDRNFGFNEWKTVKNPDVYRIEYDDNGAHKNLTSLWNY